MKISYLEQCVRGKQFVDEEPHVWKPETGMTEDDASLAESVVRWKRTTAESKCAFEGWKVSFVAADLNSNAASAERILQAGGAKVLPKGKWRKQLDVRVFDFILVTL